MFLLQLVSHVADSISNKALHSLLTCSGKRLPFPSLYGLTPFNGCLASLPFITAFHHSAFHHYLAICVDKGGAAVWLSSAS